MNDRNRLKGMLWGLVVGDCLGSPVQFMDKNDHPYITEMEPCAHFKTPAGYWTDDASMAFCIMESYIGCRKYDLADIGKKFIDWYQHGFCSSLPYAFDIGGATGSAIHKIARGSLKNGEENSQGNGSIMRFAPSYIMNLGNDNDTLLFEISDLTHNSGAVRKVINRMRRVCDSHIKGKRTRITSPYKSRDAVNNSGWAVSTLDAALWAFHTTKTFEEGMLAAVNIGGDSDTIGAVFGQIAGLYYGYDAIPERWLEAITDRKKVEDLIERFLNQQEQSEQEKSRPFCGQKCPLADYAKINYFARKWRWKFLNRYPDVGESEFADECFSLGFGMDLGESLKKAYPRNDVQSVAGLQEIIGSINDVFFLGTAIFSYWRYQTHWADFCGFAIYEDESREWLMVAFDRLIELATEYKIVLSNNDGSGHCVISAAPNRIIICDGEKSCYGPISAMYFGNKMDNFGCHYYSKHIPTDKDAEIIKNALSVKSKPILPLHDLPVEEEFWGTDDEKRDEYIFVERSDGSVIYARELKDEISLAGVFVIPDRTEVFKKIKRGQKVLLIREHDNEHDKNAIRVETIASKRKLGYIPRMTAAALAIELDRGLTHTGHIVDLDAQAQKIVVSIQHKEMKSQKKSVLPTESL